MSHLVPIPAELILSEYPCDVAYDSSGNTLILMNGVLHAVDSDGHSEHFWIPDITIYPRLHRLLTDTGFTTVRFTPFSSPDRWNLQYPDMTVGHDPITLGNFASVETAFRQHHKDRSRPDPSRRGQDPEELLHSPPTLTRNQQVRFDQDCDETKV